MLEVDGSQKSGSGTILRLSVALSAVLGQPLHIYNIRQKRGQPGLRPQHLEAVLTAAKLCDAETKGATLNSQELWFKPREIQGGSIHAEIGTAGSIPMLLLTILPLCANAEQEVRVQISKGGTDVRYSPTINYVKHVLLPILSRMGLSTALEIKKYGYYPKGMGEVFLTAQPSQELSPLCLDEFGSLKDLEGISVCTFLEDRRVAERQARAAKEYLRSRGYEADIQMVNDRSNPVQKGSSLVLWARSSSGALLGGDAIGERGKPSEVVGREAAENLCKELTAKPTVDVHLADMLVPYVALAEGRSIYLTRAITDHLDTNIWLTQEILGVEFHISEIGNLFQIEKTAS